MGFVCRILGAIAMWGVLKEENHYKEGDTRVCPILRVPFWDGFTGNPKGKTIWGVPAFLRQLYSTRMPVASVVLPGWKAHAQLV